MSDFDGTCYNCGTDQDLTHCPACGESFCQSCDLMRAAGTFAPGHEPEEHMYNDEEPI